MKKSILLFLAFSMVPLLMMGQGVGIGIKAGANFANMDIADVSTTSITSFHGGGYINLNFSKKFGITPEVLFSANGSNAEDVKVDLNYISIPLMLRFKPIDLISLEAGPQFSILTKANIEGIGDVKDQLKNNDFGLAFGAGVHLPLGINAGARYVLGFSNINDVDEESIKNRTIQIYVGWTLFGAK